MYTCKEAVDVLLEYLDGEMTPELKARLEEHFSGCAPCEDFLKQYRATVGLCRKALEKRMPESVSDRLKSFLKQNLPESKTG